MSNDRAELAKRLRELGSEPYVSREEEELLNLAAAALSAGEGGAWSLPKFFREEEPSFGFEADTESMSPEQAAITLMRRLRREVNELRNPQPRKDGEAAPNWELIAAEAYQVIAALADRCGLHDAPEVQRALDRVSGKPIDGELLPWSAPETLLGKCFECGGELSISCPHCNAPDVPAGASEEGLRAEIAKVLEDHYLAGIYCDHAAETDKPACACSRINFPAQPTIGKAVEMHVAHVLDVLLPVLRRLPPSADLLKAAKAEERERCAKIADEEYHEQARLSDIHRNDNNFEAMDRRNTAARAATNIAAAIRSAEGDEG